MALDVYCQNITIDWLDLWQSSQRAGIDAPWQETVEIEAQRQFSSEPARPWLRAWVAGIDDPFGETEISKIAEKTLHDDSGNYPRSEYELLLASE